MALWHRLNVFIRLFAGLLVFPHGMICPHRLATRKQIARKEEGCWHGRAAAMPAPLFFVRRAQPCEYNRKNGKIKPRLSGLPLAFLPWM